MSKYSSIQHRIRIKIIHKLNESQIDYSFFEDIWPSDTVQVKIFEFKCIFRKKKIKSSGRTITLIQN